MIYQVCDITNKDKIKVVFESADEQKAIDEIQNQKQKHDEKKYEIYVDFREE